MKKKFLTLVMLSATLSMITGCVDTIDGKDRFGMPFVTDKTVGRYERPGSQVWTAAKEVLNFNGKLTREDVLQKVLEATVENRTVWMKVDDADAKITRLIVQVRTKGGGTDNALAAELDKQVAVRLAGGTFPPAPVPPTR